MTSPLRQPRRAIGNVGRGSASNQRRQKPVGNQIVNSSSSQMSPMQKQAFSRLTESQRKEIIKRIAENQKKLEKKLGKAPKNTGPVQSIIPRGLKGLTNIVQPPTQGTTQRTPPQRRVNPTSMPGFGYGRSARGALGSRGRPNAKRANPSMRGGYPATATPYKGMVIIGGRQYSKGGLLKSSSKLNTGIKSGK